MCVCVTVDVPSSPQVSSPPLLVHKMVHVDMHKIVSAGNRPSHSQSNDDLTDSSDSDDDFYDAEEDTR